MIDKFKVIWFEDTHPWFTEQCDAVKDFFNEEYDVELDVKHYARPTDASGIKDDFEPDLILVDYSYSNVGSGMTGDEVIKELQAKLPYVTVIFYSAEKDFRTKVAKDFEGVYFADRNNLFDRLRNLVAVSLRNVFSVKNLRSFVIAEVAMLDEIKISTLAKILSIPDHKDIHDQFGKKIFKNRSDRATELKTAIDALDFNQLQEVTEFLARLDSDDYRKSIIRYKAKYPIINEKAKALEDYGKDVLKNRNLLAHCEEKTNDSGTPVLKSKLYKDPVEFDRAKMISLRKDLIKYKILFEEIRKAVHE